MRVLYVLIAILAIRFILNLSKYIRTKKYHNLYLVWLVSTNPTPKLHEARAQVVALLKDAGVSDRQVGAVQPVGYGHAQVGASVMENFPNGREDIATHTNAMFMEATGTYRSRLWQTFNPLFWIEFLIHLPRYTLRYLGVSADGVVIKFAQILGWIVCGVVGFSYALYEPELESMIRGWISRQ
jgi:hypothetical protein